MKTKLKRIFGVLILINFFPLICLAIGYFTNQYHSPLYMFYLVGWIINLMVAVIAGVCKLVEWCFND